MVAGRAVRVLLRRARCRDVHRSSELVELDVLIRQPVVDNLESPASSRIPEGDKIQRNGRFALINVY